MQVLVNLCQTQIHSVAEKFFFTAVEVDVKEWKVFARHKYTVWLKNSFLLL